MAARAADSTAPPTAARHGSGLRSMVCPKAPTDASASRSRPTLIASTPSSKPAIPQGDTHALWIAPGATRRLPAANDGGAKITLDGGKNWPPEDNQPTAQFYHVITDTATPYRVYGSQQDSGTVAIVSRSDDGVID